MPRKKLKPNFYSLLLWSARVQHAERAILKKIGLYCVSIDRVFIFYIVYAFYPSRWALLQQMLDVHDFILTMLLARKKEKRSWSTDATLFILSFETAQPKNHDYTFSLYKAPALKLRSRKTMTMPWRRFPRIFLTELEQCWKMPP